MTTTDSIWDDLDGGDFRRVPEGEKGAGSPLITPEGGGEAVRYMRATGYICAVEDDYGIAQWKRHLTIDGVLQWNDTDANDWAAGTWQDKVALSGRAFDSAGGWVKAGRGTRRHSHTDNLDQGLPEPDPLTAEDNADLLAYADAVAPFTLVHAEVKVVNDDLGVAGTPDRVWTMAGWAKPRIGDLKTGKIDARKCAMQMALYAHSRLYDVRTGQRTDLDVDLDVGMIVHLPYGEARARVLAVDIAAGWEGVQLCAAVHAWRRRNGMARPVREVKAAPKPVDYVVLATQASTVADLTALYARAVADDAWTFMVRNAFTLRKQQLAAVAA